MDQENAMNVLGITAIIINQVTNTELLSMYRKEARLKHPDMGGTHEAFVELQEAYELLLPLAVKTRQGKLLKNKTQDGNLLINLGKGYPLTESAKTCDTCRGKGFQQFTESIPRYVTSPCVVCEGLRVFSYKCSNCKGLGHYINPRNGEPLDPPFECEVCQGTGRYIPRPKGAAMYDARLSNDGRHGHKCRACDGHGERRQIVSEETEQVFYLTCPTCEGVGEIKMWNPVIPRGYLNNKSA